MPAVQSINSSRRTRARQPSLTAADLSKFDAHHPNRVSIRDGTPTGLKATCPSVSVTGSASDLRLFEGGTKRCGGSRKACFESNSRFLLRLSGFLRRQLGVARSRRRGGGVYGRFSTRQDRRRKFSLPLWRPWRDINITAHSPIGSSPRRNFLPP